MQKAKDIILDPLYTEIVSARRFIDMFMNERDTIESARPVPAPLGSKSLGQILVRRKSPVYEPRFGKKLSTR